MNEQNVNLIVKQEEHNEEEIVISFSAIFRKLKKYFVAWLMVAVIVGGIIAGASMFFSTTSTSPVRAIVSFNYDGIEKGQNPDGTDFTTDTLKSPRVIEAALTECGMELDLLESVRSGIEIEGIIPEDAYQRINAYKNIYENSTSGQLAAAQAMLDETYVSTKYTLTFKYKSTGMSRSDAVQVLNAMLDAYRDYFFERFGYNEALGNALSAQDYTEYDYAQAVDMFRTQLDELSRYVSSLSAEDTTRFRSTATGYTFADLKASIESVQTLDLDLISSYLDSNNISKDKERMQTYYEYRIENLERQQSTQEEILTAIETAFSSYEKDQIIIFSDSATNTESSIASDQYDKLIAQKISAQTNLSNTKSSIDFYKQRLARLKKSSSGSSDKIERIEKDLANLNDKVDTLIELVNDTANDFFLNVSLSSAYNILVPATSDVATTVRSGISKAVTPLVGVEAILLMVYLATACIEAIVEESRKRKGLAVAEGQKPKTDKDAPAESESK